jgi:hypothetical protein
MKKGLASPALSLAGELMLEYASSSGLSSALPHPQRYLWTDAFAVCNFLALYRMTGGEQYRQLALDLVHQVHNTLGRHRPDDPRKGWISGLDEKEGARHPTIGGLRIGKEFNERKQGDPYDESLEWDRDGQYYHYLTKWMHALAGVGLLTGDRLYTKWAVELAKTAHARFTYASSPGERKRMHWKMSIDLSYPLVPSMGQHDPLDGLVTYCELQALADRSGARRGRLSLREEIADMARICEGQRLVTDDPLGIGGLLADSYRMAQLIVKGAFPHAGLLAEAMDAAAEGLDYYARTAPSGGLPADYRLAFRELGLSIGLHAVGRTREILSQSPDAFENVSFLSRQAARLMRHSRLQKEIEDFWLRRRNRESDGWLLHHFINMVMLATSLIPEGFFSLW